MKVNFRDMTVGGFTFEFVRGISTQHIGAAEFGECIETIDRIKDGNFESWISEWTVTADRVANYAVKARQLGDKTSARAAFLKASNYYRMAVFYASPTDPRHTELWKRSKDCFHCMIQLMDTPIGCLDIDFEGAKLPAYFVSGGEGKRPTLIALGGFDSTMEEVYCWIGAAAADYGWNCLIFEGPGQWSALKLNPDLRFRPDYERPVKVVVDCVLSRPDVDGEKLALIGYSMGGYLAPRAAAFEPRIKACIPNTLVVDSGEAVRESLFFKLGHVSDHLLDDLYSLVGNMSASARWYLQHAQWTLGIKYPHEYLEAWKPYTLKGLEDHFHSPMLFLFSEDDIIDLAAPSPKIVQEILQFILSLKCDRAVHLFTGTEGASRHCQMGGLSYANAVIFQWLNQTLCGRELSVQSDAATRKAFVEIFKKYGGEISAEKARKVLDCAQLI
ncbi:MAG TPA: alpha/beta hydrolase [Candidatus Acidoferrales bacterium]|nr:alpha/beta hydrolase [Candidatus Acidoferrales bacterium]